MKGLRAASAVFGLAALAGAWLFYSAWTTAGFPDGHLTDYDNAINPIRAFSAGASLGMAAWAISLAFREQETRLRRKLAANAILYLGFLVTYAAIDAYFKAHLDSGQGG